MALFAREGGMLSDDYAYGFKLLIIQTLIAVVAMLFSAIVTYIIAGFTRSAILSLLFGFVLTFGTLVMIKKRAKKED